MVSLVYFLAIDPEPWRFVRELTIVCACQTLLLAGGYLANDYFDRHRDRLDPRRLPMSESGARARATASILLLGAGLVTAHALGSAPSTPAIAWGQVMLGLAYSIPGARLKERGAIGLVAAALLQRLPAFAMIVLAFPAHLAVAALLGSWLSVLGLVTILEHQMNDESADRAAGVRTWCVARGWSAALRVRSALYRVFAANTLVVAAFLAWSPGAVRGIVSAIIMLVIGFGFVILAPRRFRRDARPETRARLDAAPAPP